MGDPYDPEKIRELPALWEVGLLENLSIERSVGRGRRHAGVSVEERPTIQTIDSPGTRVSASQIREPA